MLRGKAKTALPCEDNLVKEGRTMTAERVDQPQSPEKERAAVAIPAESNAGGPAPRALPKGVPQPETGEPGGGRGRVDVTGIVPEDIHVDPNLTEGHPGYTESGGSEIIPPKPLPAERTTTDEKRRD
jgi:hypothetical protein